MACTGRAGCRTGGRRSFDESASARHHTPVVCKYRRGRRRHGLPPNHEQVPPNRRRRTGPPARPSPALRAPAFQATTSHRLCTGAPFQPIADCDRVPSRRSQSHWQATGQIRRAPIGSFKYPSGGGLMVPAKTHCRGRVVKAAGAASRIRLGGNQGALSGPLPRKTPDRTQLEITPRATSASAVAGWCRRVRLRGRPRQMFGAE